MVRGRKPIYEERATTTVSVEKEDLDRLKDLGIELSDLVGKAIKETLRINNNKLFLLKTKATELKNIIQDSQIELKSVELEIKRLESRRIKEQKELFGYSKKCTHRENMACYYKPTPLNSKKEGTEYHHMYLKIGDKRSQSIGIYIPKELHKSIKHQSRTGNNMREINKASLLWLAEQAEI